MTKRINLPPGTISADKSGGTFFGGWDVGALAIVDDSTRTFDPSLAGGTGIDSIMYGIAAVILLVYYYHKCGGYPRYRWCE